MPPTLDQSSLDPGPPRSALRGAARDRSNDHPLVLSFLAVRRSIGYLGGALPVLLVPGGWLVYGTPIQDNLSAYYHTPLRDVLVGVLVGLGVLLFVYRGHDRLEDWTATLGGVFALGLALFPIDPLVGLGSFAGSPAAASRVPDELFDPFAPRSWPGLIHTVCGGGFFLTLALYSLFYFPAVLHPPVPPEDPSRPERHPVQRNRLYRLSGVSILLSMAAMGVYLVLLPPAWQARADAFHLLLWLEWIAIWSFAAAWLLKGRVIGAELTVDLLAAVEDKVLRRA